MNYENSPEQLQLARVHSKVGTKPYVGYISTNLHTYQAKQCVKKRLHKRSLWPADRIFKTRELSHYCLLRIRYSKQF